MRVGYIVMAMAAMGIVAVAADRVPATQPAKPRRVVFVVDTTGSMMTKLDAVRQQVAQGVNELDDKDEFNILTFSEDTVSALSTTNLKHSSESLNRAHTFLDNAKAHGSGDYVDAVAMAIKLGADLIWIVSDGDVSSPAEVVARLKKGNPKHIPINTVLHFTDGIDESRYMLWKIAADSGGVCLDETGKPVNLERKDPPKTPPITGPSIFKEK